MRCRSPKTTRELLAPLLAAGLIVGVTGAAVLLRKNGLSEELFEIFYALMLAAVAVGYAVAGGGCCRSRRAPRETDPVDPPDDSMRRWPNA